MDDNYKPEWGRLLNSLFSCIIFFYLCLFFTCLLLVLLPFFKQRIHFLTIQTTICSLFEELSNTKYTRPKNKTLPWKFKNTSQKEQNIIFSFKMSASPTLKHCNPHQNQGNIYTENKLQISTSRKIKTESNAELYKLHKTQSTEKLTTMYSLLNPLVLWLLVLCLLMLFTLTRVSSSNFPRSSIDNLLKRFSPSSILRFTSI